MKEHQPELVYINAGINSDSDMPSKVPEEKHYEGYQVDKTSIYPVLCDVKVIKSEAEIDVLRWATKITIEGHVEVLRQCKPGMREMQLDSILRHYCEHKYFCGKVQPY